MESLFKFSLTGSLSFLTLFHPLSLPLSLCGAVRKKMSCLLLFKWFLGFLKHHLGCFAWGLPSARTHTHTLTHTRTVHTHTHTHTHTKIKFWLIFHVALLWMRRRGIWNFFELLDLVDRFSLLNQKLVGDVTSWAYYDWVSTYTACLDFWLLIHFACWSSNWIKTYWFSLMTLFISYLCLLCLFDCTRLGSIKKLENPHLSIWCGKCVCSLALSVFFSWSKSLMCICYQT